MYIASAQETRPITSGAVTPTSEARSNGPLQPTGTSGMPYQQLVEHLVKLLVEHPDDVMMETVEQGNAVTLKLHVARADVGRVIGKQGKTARAIRSLLHAMAARAGRRVALQIIE